jgi:AcrR family transcriptional regulator
VRRTRKLLRQGLIELLHQKPVAEITVKELAEHLDMSRATFYKYYNDVHDLVSQLENRLAHDFRAIVRKPECNDIEYYPGPLLIHLFDYVRANADISAVLLGNNGNREFVCSMRDILKAQALKNFEAIVVLENPRLLGYYSAFVLDGSISVISNWLEHGMVESSENMAEIIINMVPNAHQSIQISRK